MSSNLNEFVLGIEDFENEVPKMVTERHQAALMEAVGGIVQMTPVKSGRARGNWQVTHGSPASGTVERLDKNGPATISAAAAVIEESEPYSVSYITNNLPYIEALEGGSSTQAPAGMLNVTFSRLQSWLARRR